MLCSAIFEQCTIINPNNAVDSNLSYRSSTTNLIFLKHLVRVFTFFCTHDFFSVSSLFLHSINIQSESAYKNLS